ncbi:MAG TPA: chorismate synthase [Syntrophomonadaceae bacterium]|nr:chorismate synthase [Syntrophomonadaceae bacterium]HPR93643.1 chorismate synthase [Syntrophomonadaceae bacterium]
MLKFTSAGESHGKGLTGIIEGLPAGLKISENEVNDELKRRQQGYGRGGRMLIETDTAEFLSGVRNGMTLGSPVSFFIENKDYKNWQQIMDSGPLDSTDEKVVTRPRPGHADLAGAIKYNHTDMRNVLERASARETAVRVAAGVFFKKLLQQFSIYIYSEVIAIGGLQSKAFRPDHKNLAQFYRLTGKSQLGCTDLNQEDKMIKMIDDARRQGESLGGVFELGAIGVLPGLGSYISFDRRLDARLAGLLMSIPAIKAVEIGEGIDNSAKPGSLVHDEIYYSSERGIYRKTNKAGGIEGGISNGEIILGRAYMKPIPTLYKPLQSINTALWQEEKATVERSDVCAVPAAAVVGEAMLAFGIAEALLVQLGGDNMGQMLRNYNSYRKYVKKVWQWGKI